MSGGPPIAPLASRGQRRVADRSRSIHAPFTRQGDHRGVSPEPARADRFEDSQAIGRLGERMMAGRSGTGGGGRRRAAEAYDVLTVHTKRR